MAGVTYPIGSDQLTQQRKGYIAISLTNFNSSVLVSEIALGSRLEIAGAVVGFEANESMGAGWAVLPQGIVYVRIDSINLTSEYTTVAPTWNTELQGWYDATNQYRYYAKLYKDAGGNYTQKSLYTNNRSYMTTYNGEAFNTGANGDHEIRVASDSRQLWDESEDRWDFDKGINISAGGARIANGDLTMVDGDVICSNDIKGFIGIRHEKYLVYGNKSENNIFDELAVYLFNVTPVARRASGAIYDIVAAEMFIIASARRAGPAVIYLNCMNITTLLPEVISINNGGATTYRACISI